MSSTNFNHPPTPLPTPPACTVTSSADQSAQTPINPAGNSTSWQSNRHDTITKLTRLHNTAAHIGVASSPFFPKTVAEHVKHVADYKADCMAAEVRKMDGHLEVTRAVGKVLEGLEGEARKREKVRMRVGALMGGRTLSVEGGRKTAVLAEKSIWCPGGKEENEVSWPRLEEIKAEGEMQARQGLARKLPLPKLNKLKDIDRSEMMNSGEMGMEEVEKMEAGKMPMPFRMKAVVSIEEFDETLEGRGERVARGLAKHKMEIGEKAIELDELEVRQKCWLGRDLLSEL